MTDGLINLFPYFITTLQSGILRGILYSDKYTKYGILDW